MKSNSIKGDTVFANLRKIAFFVLSILAIIGWTAGWAAPSEAKAMYSVAVVVSQKIRPYLDALQGIQSAFEKEEGVRLEVLFMEAEKDPEHKSLIRRLEKEKFDLLLAVGPEAMELIWNAFPKEAVPKIFAMVLHPEKIAPGSSALCGIPLGIPVQTQVMEFSRNLPRVKRIGLIYDPVNNSDFAAGAEQAAREYGINIVPLKVGARSDILSVFQNQWRDITALWMIPDHTVISESLILFMIKEAIAKNVAVLGYNRFFTDSGAAMALACDYQAIGKQAAGMALDKLAGGACHVEVPAYRVLLNTQVLEALKIPYGIDPAAAGGANSP